MIRIIHVEDDRSEAEHVRQMLEVEFTTRGVSIQRVCTECEFRTMLDDIARNPPTLVLMDIMLRWCDPAPDLKKPPVDVRNGGYERAGLRCQRLLWAKNPKIPVVFYTVLHEADLEGGSRQVERNVVFISKGPDFNELFDKIREIAAKAAGIEIR
jgi:DNA-binding NarL/FixJ family response regulator